MRFLLINPFCPISEGPTPPLGLSFVAAALERAGIEVKILDFVIFPYSFDTLSKVLNKFQPDIVGATSVTMTFNNAVNIIKDVKRINKDIVTIMGGPHVTFCAEETFIHYPEVDYILLGESEETIVEFCRELEKGQNWRRIKGLAYRDGSDICQTEQRLPIDVNTLPLPARHLLPLGRYRTLNTAISMTTSRGCPFKCIFCIGRKMVGAKVRYREPMSVVNEFEYLSTLGFPQINIADDLFTAKKEHCLSICNEIINRDLNIKWSSFARVDTVSPAVLEKMKIAGCSAISFGVETANTEILKTIKKGITLPKVINAINMCTDAGIEPHVSFILGLPGETPETLKETQEFGEKITAIGASFGYHLLAPFPGTAVRDENEKYDLKILTDDWTQYHANRAIVETDAVKKEVLNDIAIKWDHDVIEKLDNIRTSMEQGSASKDDAWQIQNLDRFIFIYDLMMNGVIEEKGTWQNGEGPVEYQQALKELSSKISPLTGKDNREAFEFLNYIDDKKGLNLSQENDIVKWEWNDYL